MKLNLLLSFILLFNTVSGFAQTDAKSQVPKTMGVQAQLSGSVFTFFMQARGSQYLIDEWLEGEVLLNTGHKVLGELLRYNAYLDELLWLPYIGGSPVMIDKGLVDCFFLKTIQDTLLFRKVDDFPAMRDKGKGVFLQELFVSEYSLFAHRKVVKKRESVESIGGSTFARPTIQPETDYYLVKPDGDIATFTRLSNRRFARLFEGNEREVRRAMREKGIRLDDERGLLQAMQLVESVL